MITSGILNDVLAENTKLKDGGNEPSYSSKLQLDPNPQQKPNYQSYRSMEIFQNHKKLIDEDELLQKKIDLNKQQA